jgi:hypothetical protein
MPYDIQLPDGTLVDNIPDNIDPVAAKAKIFQVYPELALGEKKTLGQVGKDVLAGVGSGLGSLAQFPGQVYGLVTGDMDQGGLQQLGRNLQQYSEEAKSPIQKAKESLRSQKIAQTEGVFNQAGVAILETLKDPALLSSFIFEQAPQLLGTMGGGYITKQGVKALMLNATQEVLAKSGVRGAVGTGSLMQGADIGTDTYERIFNERMIQGYPEQLAREEALTGGRKAAVEAAALTGLTSFGAGSTIERALTRGAAAGPKRGIIRGTLGETLSEAVEEGGGRLASNIEFQKVKPESDVLEGVGAAIGMGALGGGLFGLPSSILNSADANQIARAKAQMEEAKRRAQEENKPQEILLQIGYDPNVQGKVINTPIIVNPDGTTTFPSERNKFAQVVPNELSEEGMSEKYGIRTEEQIKNQTFSPETIKGFGISPKANIYKNKDIVNADLADPAQADKVKGALVDYLKKYPNANPEIRKKVISYLLRQEFHRLPESQVPTQITEASITPEADQAAIQQRLSEGFRNRPEIKKFYDDYNKMMQEGDADKAALSAFNSIVTPQVIKSFGIPANSAIYGDQELINADLSNPETADRIRAKLMDLQKQTKSAKIKENIDKYLNRSEFITPTYVEQFLNPVREEGQENLDHFVFVNNEGEIESKYGTIVEKGGKKYAKYSDNKFQKGGDRELNENVLVNPKSPDQIELMSLYKAKEKLMKEPDNFKQWLMKYGVNSKERSDMGIETRIPHKMFRENGYGLDELVLAAINDGILTEGDFDMYANNGGVEQMKEYIKKALAGEFVPTLNNTRNIMDLENLQNRIEQLEEEVKGTPEEAIAQEFRGEETPISKKQENKQYLSTEFTTSKDGYIADKNGNPIVFYHTTRALDENGKQIKELIPGGPNGTGSGKAIWFGSDPNQMQAAHNAPIGKEGSYTIPAYIKMENPLYIDEFNYEEQRAKWGPDLPFSLSDERVKKLKDAGFDGIISEIGDQKGKVEEIVVFDKNQITFKADYQTSTPSTPPPKKPLTAKDVIAGMDAKIAEGKNQSKEGLTSDQLEVLDLADKVESAGEAGFANSMRQNVRRRNILTPQNMDFYRNQAEQFMSRVGKAKSPIKEKFDINTFVEGFDRDKARLASQTDFFGTKTSSTVEKSNYYIKKLAEKINQAGYKVIEINSTTPKYLQKLKTKISQIAGSTTRLMKEQEALDKGYQRANIEKLNKTLQTLNQDFTESDELLKQNLQIADDSRTIDVEAIEITPQEIKLLTNQTSKLSAEETATLEEHYGEEAGSEAFLKRVREDIITFTNKGANAVAKAIRDIIAKLQAGMLSVAMIFNPAYMSQQSAVVYPDKTVEVKATVPDSASDMSEGAKKSYSTLYPALKPEMEKNNKYFTIVDKPNSKMYVFNPDGSLMIKSNVVLGKALGDVYVGQTQFKQNQITPAGLIKAKAEKGSATYDGKTVYTFGNVKEGWNAVFMHTVYLKESDAEARKKALATGQGTRLSHGCVNGPAELMQKIDNESMNESHVFIVPDNQAAVDDYIANNVSNEDLTRETVKPVTKTTKVPEKPSPRDLVGREEQVATEVKSQKESKSEVSQTPYADKFIKDSQKLGKDIRAALDKMGLKDVGVKFEDALQKRIDGKMTRVNGEYFDKMIELSLSGDNIFRTMNHEALHALKDLGFFSDKDWNVLKDKARSEWMEKYKIADSYSNETAEVQLEEAIAYAFADMQTQPGQVKSIMASVVNFFKRIGNWMRGNGYRTAEDIFGKAAAGELKSINVKAANKEARFEKKMKASFEGVDEAYADAIKKQFFQEEATVSEKFKNLKSNFFEKMVTGIFDEFRAIRKYTTEGYMMARLSKSIDGGLQGLLEHGQVYIKDGALDIRPNTKGLLEILEPLGAEVDQYQIWKALSRDAQMSADKRSFDTDLVAGRDNLTKGTIDGKSRKEIYEKARLEENQLNKSVLDVALQSGLIDKQAYQVFSNDINYIPFYKMMEDGDVDSVNASSKLTGQYFSKALKGGEKKTNDLMENVLLNWSHILSASMKNQAAVKTIKAAESMDAAVKAKPMDGKYPPNTIKVMEEGKTTHYTLEDPDLVDAISTISYLGPKSAFLDVAKGFTNALRYGITLSPAYKVRNLIRDSLQSAAVSELGPNMFNNVYNGLRMSSKGDPTFMSALAGGGIFEMGTAHEGDQAKLIKRLIDKGIRESTILDTPEKIKGKLQDLLNSYNELGNKFENANRLALYKKLIDSGKSHLEASYAARDLMDFSMQGQFRAIKIIGSVVPFFNARLQGLYKLGRDGITPTYRVICNATTGAELRIGDKEKAQRFMVMSSAIALASILLYGAYKDDEDFQRREGWDRDNFWWFKIGDTQFRIPKPFEIGAFGTIAERTYEQIVDDSVEGKVFGERLNHILMDTFSLNPMPQMIKPLIDLYANKDSFTSAPIESAGMERLSKQERLTNKTSGVAIALGGISEGAAKILTFNPDAQGFSPVQMDYAIKAYLGWLGATAVSTADLAVEPFTEGTRVRPPVIDTLAMGFIKTEPQTQSKYMTQFYENNARLQSALADMRHYAEMGDMEKVAKIMEEKGDDIALSKVYDKATKQLAQLRKQSRMIEQMKDISTDDKRAEMNRLKILMSDIAKEMESVRKSR